MGQQHVPVSDGELVDKYTVLQLKSERIQDEKKLFNIDKEMRHLYPFVASLKNQFPIYYHLLYNVNKIIWDKTDDIKAMDSKDPQYAQLACDIFSYNDKRFRIKRVFNTNSDIKEQKSYEEKSVFIITKNPSLLLEKIPELTFLSLEYDKLYFLDTDPIIEEKLYFLNPQFIYHRSEISKYTDNIVIDDFTITNRDFFIL